MFLPPKMSIALGQNVNYISLLERGKLLPSMSSFLYICQYLCITPQQFFTLHSKNPKDQQALIELFNQLENDFTDHILALMHIAIEAEKNKSRQYTQMRRGENSHE